MGEETEEVEQRLKSLQPQLQTEIGIFERLIYKNKNQHRRSSYFQFLLKVRRDLKLLQLANLEEILNSCFHVINGKNPKQKVQLLESLKRKRSDRGKPTFLERLLGVARLLSQMVEPILKAAIEMSTLLAQSFFMGFSLTILALLARIRVLIQQMLLDVVCTFNAAFSLSQKEQAVQITEDGLQVFREYYPMRNESVISLECVWQTDKYMLVEKVNESTTINPNKEHCEDVMVGASAIQYQSVNALLGGDPPCEVAGSNSIVAADSLSSCAVEQQNQEKGVKDAATTGDGGQSSMTEEGNLGATPVLNPLKRKSASKEKVAFVSVKATAFTSVNSLDSSSKTKI